MSMSEKWLSGSSSESGILRKAKPPHKADNLDDLLVFGYACKIFRDNERAKQIDHGKHLIPWMGDNTLKIDRYDVRATLSDISQYEAPPGGYTDRLGFLTPSEQRAEQLCEEERYFSLYNNDVEEEMHQEEELKRLHKQRSSTYGQVPFSYDKKNDNEDIKPVDEQKEEEPDEVFVPHPKFYIPPDIELPDTMKLNAIIEKTAKFISTQGPQMEILIKAKQSNNPQFEFLNQNNRVNKYYKHVLNAMKNGFYPETEVVQEDKPEPTQPIKEEPIQPISTVIQYPVVPVPILKYKPSADCSYTQLISKIKGVPMPLENSTTDVHPSLPVNITKFSTDPNYGIYDYRNYAAAKPFTTTNVETPVVHSIPPVTLTVSQPSIVHVSNVNLPPTPKNVPPENENTKPIVSSMVDGVAVKKISTGLMLAQSYNSDSDTDQENDGNSNKELNLDFPVPPSDLQNIIDKTAAYVLKNGKEFEDILRTKNDPRFSFLSHTDEFHRYYTFKVTGAIPPSLILHTNGQAQKTTVTSLAPLVPTPARPTLLPTTNQKQKNELVEPKVITSVSFSIKSKEDQPVISLKPALPQELSSEDDDESADTQIDQTKIIVPKAGVAISPVVVAEPTELKLSNLLLANVPSNGIVRETTPNKLIDKNVVTVKTDLDLSESSLRDAMLESNSPTLDEKREAKRAEDKFKDRLAQARGRLGQITKEKQLQLERKKKAMAFLNQIKTTTASMTVPTTSVISTVSTILTPVEIDFKQIVDVDGIDVESETSVQSIHSSPSQTEILNNGDIDSEKDDEKVIEIQVDRSRSRSKSTSHKRHKRKKSKHHHSKKKSSKRKASRSRSRSRDKERKQGASSSSSSRKHSSSSHKSSKIRRYKDD